MATAGGEVNGPKLTRMLLKKKIPTVCFLYGKMHDKMVTEIQRIHSHLKNELKSKFINITPYK